MGSAVYKVRGQAAMGPLWLGAAVPAGEAYRVMHVTLRYSAAPTTSENLTIGLDSHAGAVYDTVFYTLDPSASSVSHVVWFPDGFEWIVEGGDVVAVSYANTDNNTIGAEITLKRV